MQDTDTYVCRVCEREVPIANQSLHTARCFRKQSSHPSAPVISLDSDDDMKYSSDRANSVKTESNQLSDVINLVDEPVPSAPPISSPGVDLIQCMNCNGWSNVSTNTCDHCGFNPQKIWKCKRCTFFNSMSQLQCEMCSSTKEETNISGQQMELEDNNGMSTGSGWVCKQCTFANNHPSSTRCEVCAAVPRGEAAPIINSSDSSSSSYGSSDANPTSSDSYTLPATLLGGVIGAGTAYMENRSVFNGAIQGAGLGLMGGMLLDHQDLSLGHRNNNFDNFGFNYDAVRSRQLISPMLSPEMFDSRIRTRVYGSDFSR